MKKLGMFLYAMIFVLSLSGVAGAITLELIPNDSDLGDLEHGHYYTWGMEVAPLYAIESVTLTFSSIRNWNSKTNDLWVHLLDNTDLGVQAYIDNDSGQVDQFAGNGPLLNQWHNISATAQDITYVFSEDEIASLISYSADGAFGLGFDPDCHFYNNGIKLTIETAPVPEPATMILLGTGLVGLAGLKRRKKK